MSTMWMAVVAVLWGDDDLAAAAKKAAEMTNYTFRLEAKGEGNLGKGGGKPLSVTGHYDGSVICFKSKSDAYRKGDTLVVQDQDGNWSKVEPPQKGGGKPEGGQKPEGDKGQRGGKMLQMVRAPHEECAEFETKFKEVSKAEESGFSVFSGPLTDEAALDFSPRRPGGGGGKAQLATSGSAKVWVDGQGNIAKYEITVTMKGTIKDKEIDATITRTVEISEVGSTKFEVPEGASKLLNP